MLYNTQYFTFKTKEWILVFEMVSTFFFSISNDYGKMTTLATTSYSISLSVWHRNGYDNVGLGGINLLRCCREVQDLLMPIHTQHAASKQIRHAAAI